MNEDEKHDCPSLQLHVLEDGCPWQDNQLSPAALYSAVEDESAERALPSSPLVLILANAEKIRKCPLCRRAFTRAFQIPELWWTEYSQRSNGYFGCDTVSDGNGKIATVHTWSRFLIKQLYDRKQDGKDEIDHEWYHVNVFVKWSAALKQTIVLLFDAPTPLRDRVPTPLFESATRRLLEDPFLIHIYLVEEVVRLQDIAVWKLRTYVRTLEKERLKDTPSPNYQGLHDLARHAIHVCETLELSVKTMDSIIAHHTAFRKEAAEAGSFNRSTYRHVHQRLAFFHHMLESLRCRSSSNKERLDNEMQLAFHTVAQYDSRTSVKIARAAQLDSAAMKTVSFLTLAFLPATFISAVFSMSFFTVNDDSGEWEVSDKFWLYWVFAVPVTLLTTGLWWMWQQNLKYPMIGRADSDMRFRSSKRDLGGVELDELERIPAV